MPASMNQAFPHLIYMLHLSVRLSTIRSKKATVGNTYQERKKCIIISGFLAILPKCWSVKGCSDWLLHVSPQQYQIFYTHTSNLICSFFLHATRMEQVTYLLDCEAITISMVSTPMPMMLMTACPASVLARLKMHKDWRLGALLQGRKTQPWDSNHRKGYLPDSIHPPRCIIVNTNPKTRSH